MLTRQPPPADYLLAPRIARSRSSEPSARAVSKSVVYSCRNTHSDFRRVFQATAVDESAELEEKTAKVYSLTCTSCGVSGLDSLDFTSGMRRLVSANHDVPLSFWPNFKEEITRRTLDCGSIAQQLQSAKDAIRIPL